MKNHWRHFSLFLVVVAAAAELPPASLIESSLQTRVGFDANPTGTAGTIAAVPGGQDVFTYAANATFGLALSAPAPQKASLKITYAGEWRRFAGCPSENYATHRVSFSGQISTRVWQFSGEGSTCLIDGSSDTLNSVPSMNANAIPLWRERRHQWQHRLKLQTQGDFGTQVLRVSGTVLDYDYHTRVTPGKIAFADRADALAAFDLGWKHPPHSLWLGGIRFGRQNQAIIPLPNCAFDYSNDYYRLAVGWEGKPCENTTLSFSAGPDFRHYTGEIDSRVMPEGRTRTSLWVEGGFVMKLTPTWQLSGKVAQMDWLASTGKSAYVDSVAEATASWTASSAWTLRLSAKGHRCDYFPAVRDDWEYLLGAGATRTISKHCQLNLDVLRHQAGNAIPAFPGREFQRFVISLGAVISL